MVTTIKMQIADGKFTIRLGNLDVNVAYLTTYILYGAIDGA